MKKIVLDAAGLFKITLINGDYFYTTYQVLDEVKSQAEKEIVNRYIREGKLSVVEVSDKEIKEIEKQLTISKGLSEADFSLLALAKKLGDTKVYTDDYELQNALSLLGIEFEGVKVKRIKKKIVWVYRCAYCGRTYNYKLEECPVCGGPVRRKALKKFSV